MTGALALAASVSIGLAAQQQQQPPPPPPPQQPPPPSPQGPTFKSGTQIVSLFVTVADAARRLIPGLTQEEFEVYDNEKPQPIVFFQNEIQPITVVMLLDHLGESAAAKQVMKAIEQVTANPALQTGDLGGKARTADVTRAVCEIVANG